VELRSSNAPFILGVYRYATDQASCNDLICIMETDFTSESIVWRPSPEQKYKLAVSLLPSPTSIVGEDDGDLLGTYELTVLESEAYCRIFQVADQAFLLPGSC